MESTGQDAVLIGYSARVAIQSVGLVDAQRQNLFRPEVQAALSVDDMIWPDVFTSDCGIKRPEWVGYVQDLWASLPNLLRTAAEAGLQEDHDFSAIAVRVLVDRSSQERWTSRLGEIEPAELPSRARLLGFDVADEFLMSALCNGVFFAGESRDALRAQWAQHLSPYHLFTDRDAATDFLSAAESRFPEHVPFFVFEVLSMTHAPAPHPLRTPIDRHETQEVER